MAPGLILRISLICVFLFGCSAVSPTNKVPALHNYGDDDEAMFSEFVDQSNWQTNNKPAAPVSTNRPSVTYGPVPFQSLKKQPNAPRSAEMVRLHNGRPRDWSRENPDASLLFPLSPNSQKSDPGKPQPGRVIKYPSEGTLPSSHAATPTGNDEDLSKGSSPSPTPQKGSFAGNPYYGPVGTIYPVSLGSPSVGLSGGKRGPSPGFSPPRNRPPKPVPATQTASEQPPPPPTSPPVSPRIIVQSRNGYQRASYLQSKSRYSPQVHPSAPEEPSKG
ncbi:uncharacterized protein LOC120828297 [Gasterosteus aculeatus]